MDIQERYWDEHMRTVEAILEIVSGNGWSITFKEMIDGYNIYLGMTYIKHWKVPEQQHCPAKNGGWDPFGCKDAGCGRYELVIDFESCHHEAKPNDDHKPEDNTDDHKPEKDTDDHKPEKDADDHKPNSLMTKEHLWAMLTAPTSIPFDTYKAIMSVMLNDDAMLNVIIN